MRSHLMLAFSLPLTISGAMTATPVVLQPIREITKPTTYAPSLPPKPVTHEVIASWYGSEFAGRPTASGQRFEPRQLTAASKTLPLGSVIKVENPTNRRSVRVVINDCGPHVPGRGLDLSLRAAQKIGITRKGVAHVTITNIKAAPHMNHCGP
jgi:rare lipoprotein A